MKVVLTMAGTAARNIIAHEYPNDIRAQVIAMHNIVVEGSVLAVMQERVQIGYDAEKKQISATLATGDRAAFEQHIADLATAKQLGPQNTFLGMTGETSNTDE